MKDLSQCQQIIVFGGSFDPPHLAHVRLPRTAMQSVGADAVAYVPCAVQPLKQHQQVTEARHRLAMLQLALADQPWAAIVTDELDRAADGQPSYTVDTLERLHRQLGPAVRLRLLIGIDQLRLFDRWKSPARIEALAEPLVMLRPPDTRESVMQAVPAGMDPMVWLNRLVAVPQMDISSTMIRQRISQGQRADDMLPGEVARYIREHGLYRRQEGSDLTV